MVGSVSDTARIGQPWGAIQHGVTGTIFFKDTQFPKELILHAVLFYLRYGVSYRELEEILTERGLKRPSTGSKLQT